MTSTGGSTLEDIENLPRCLHIFNISNSPVRHYIDQLSRFGAKEYGVVVNDIGGTQRSIPIHNLSHPFQFLDLAPGESRRVLTDLHFSAVFSQKRYIPLTLLPMFLQFDVSPASAFVEVEGGAKWSTSEVEIDNLEEAMRGICKRL